MIEICFPDRTIYDCNPFQTGPNMSAMSEIILESRDYDLLTNLDCNHIRPFRDHHCNHKWFSPLELMPGQPELAASEFRTSLNWSS